jgi:hypothetical protein
MSRTATTVTVAALAALLGARAQATTPLPAGPVLLNTADPRRPR